MDNKRVNYLLIGFLLGITLSWTFSFVSLATITYQSQNMEKEIKSYLDDKGVDTENILVKSIPTNSDSGEFIAYVTQLDGLKEYAFLYNEEIVDITSHLQKVTDNFTKDLDKHKHIKKVYYGLRNAFDSNYSIPYQHINTYQELKTLFHQSDYHIQYMKIDFLYENNGVKKLEKNKSITHINGKEVLNEARDFQDIKSIFGKLDKGYQQVYAFMDLKDKRTLIYYNSEERQIEYLEVNGDKISQPKKMDKRLSKEIEEFLK